MPGCGFFGQRTHYDFLKEYEEIVHDLDGSSVKLRQSLDTMSATTEMILRQFDGILKHEERQHVRNENLQRCTYLAKYLMQTIHDSVVDNKNTTFRLLIRHLKYTAGIFNDKLKSSDPVDEIFNLESTRKIQFDEGEFEDFKKEVSDLDKLRNESETMSSDLDRLMVDKENNRMGQIKQLEETIDNLKKQLESANKQNRDMGIYIKNLKRNNENITSDYEKKSRQMADTLKTEVGTLKTVHDRIHGNADSHLKELKLQCSSLKSEKEQVQTREAKMINELDTAKRKISNMEDLQKENENKISQLESSLQSENKQVEDLERKMDDIQKGHEKAINQLEQLKKEGIETLKAQMKNELDTADSQRKQLQEEKEEVEALNAEIKHDLDVAESLRKQLQKDKDELVATLQTKTKEFETDVNLKTKQIEQLNLQLKTITTDSEKQRTELLQEMSTLNQEKVNLSDHICKQTDLADKLSEQIEMVSLELQELKRITSKKMITMQIWFNQRTAVTGGIEQEVMSVIKTEFDSDRVEIRYKRCAGRADVEDEHPLIVICVAASRIGTDAANAVQGVNMSSNTALVIVHPKDSHALPQQASDRVLTSPEYRQLAGIFDIAYQRGKGVYDCTMNTTNIIGLVTFVDKVGVRRPMFE